MRLIALFIIVFAVKHLPAQTNCGNAQPFCTGTTYTFPATTNVTAQTGPAYGCLSTQPNPAWYYLQIANSGSLVISIAAQTASATSGWDVDFICWGPFSSLTNVCSSLTGPNTIDCSYSSSATETCTIPNGVTGQFYMLCMTNFANINQNFVFSQVGGNGSTNCAILCDIVSVTNSVSTCGPASNTYSVSGFINMFSPPPTGSLIINNSCGSPPIILTAPFSSVIPYSLTGLNSSGSVCNLNVSFSAVSGCTFELLYNEPSPCVVTGMPDSPMERFELYPNPAKDAVTLNFGTFFSGEIKICDHLGSEKVFQTLVKEPSFILDLSAYSRGIYFLRSRSDKGEEKTVRIIKE